MSFINLEPPPPRFTEESTPEGVRVVVPVVKDWHIGVGCPVLLVLLVWAKWQDAEHFWTGADRGFASGAWLVFWVVIALVIFGYWIWMMLGREIFLMRPEALEVRRRILGLSWKYTFPWDEICDVRFRPERGHGHVLGVFLLSDDFRRSAVVFEHGGRTYVFARGLEGVEADHIIALMQQHVPVPLSPDEQLFRSLW